jgi:hypothetical protein
MESGQYHRVLLPIELISDNKRISVATLWNKYQYKFIAIHRKGKHGEPDTQIGWTERIVSLLSEDCETHEWASEAWIRSDLLEFVESGIVRISWEPDDMGHIFLFLGKIAMKTKSYLDKAYPELFDHSRESRVFSFPNSEELTDEEKSRDMSVEKLKGRENSHRKFL